jgi:hypothetical protein
LRENVATLLQLSALGLLTIAGFLVSVPAGLAAIAVCLFVIGLSL